MWGLLPPPPPGFLGGGKAYSHPFLGARIHQNKIFDHLLSAGWSTHIHTYTHICAYTHIMHMHIHAYTCTYPYRYIYTYTHKLVHTYTQTHIHTCAHKYTERSQSAHGRLEAGGTAHSPPHTPPPDGPRRRWRTFVLDDSFPLTPFLLRRLLCLLWPRGKGGELAGFMTVKQ